MDKIVVAYNLNGFSAKDFDTSRVLVTGGRTFGQVIGEVELLLEVLDRLNPYLVINGGADGADELSRFWAKENGKPCLQYFANWTRDGKAAGPIRNSFMLSEGKPTVVVAFKGGRGTDHTVEQAMNGGYTVLDLRKVEQE